MTDTSPRVALFVTCLADTLFPDVGRATLTVLERLGCEVVFPRAQTCCGQAHVNTGYQRDALPLVRGFVDLHGGRAWVEDRAGGGAAFRVWLPQPLDAQA